MNIRPIVLAACALCTAPALAQTNLSFYGLVDTGIHIADTGQGRRQVNLASGIADGSRFGVKGTENLGDGYTAVFTLEGRFEAETGGNQNKYPTSNVGAALTRGLSGPAAAAVASQLQQGAVVNPKGALFERAAFVGVITPGGAILLGHQYTPGYEVLAMADAFETGTAGGWGNLILGTGGHLTAGVAIRSNTAVQYRVEHPSGLAGALMYAQASTANADAGDGVGSLNYSRRFWGSNIRYKANRWNVGLGYNSEQNQSGQKSLHGVSAGGSYDFGIAKVFAGYHRMKNENSILVRAVSGALQGTPFAALAPALSAGIGGNARLDAATYSIGFQYPVARGWITAAVSRFDDRQRANAQATLYGAGYYHILSRRTNLYAVYAHVSNNDAAQYGLGGSGYTGGFSAAPGKDTKAIQFGIRHRF